MAEDGLVQGVSAPLRAGRGRSRWGWRSVAFLASLCLLLTGAAGGYLYLTGPTRAGRIARGVEAGGVDLSNLLPEEALIRLRHNLPSLGNLKVRAKAGEGEMQTNAAALGAVWNLAPAIKDSMAVGREPGAIAQWRSLVIALRRGRHFPVPVSIERPRLMLALLKVARTVYRQPHNAGIHFSDTDSDDPVITIKPSRPGRALDLAGSARIIARLIAQQGPLAAPLDVRLPVTKVSARITEAVLSRINGKVGEFTTHYHPWQAARTHNLWLAAHAINGALVMPGQVFSYNHQVGQRLVSRGYEAAPIFVKGKVKDDTGGGVCQVATTIYNAALLADCRIVERSPHGMRTSYIPTGRDATVAWDALDFKFRDTRPGPILVSTEMGDGDLTVRFWGHVIPGEKVDVFTRNVDDGVITYRRVRDPDGRVHLQIVSRDPDQKVATE